MVRVQSSFSNEVFYSIKQPSCSILSDVGLALLGEDKTVTADALAIFSPLLEPLQITGHHIKHAHVEQNI